MSTLISCQGLTKTYGARPLFEGLSFGVFAGERAGLIGPNGAGKSTLLKILAGLEKPDEGELAVRRGIRVGYLAQQDRFAEGEDISVGAELALALGGLGLEDYEIDIRVEDGLAGSGFAADQRVKALSGGWRKRLAILSQVIRRPDLLLLDEPTNHLDVAGVLWLEQLMAGVDFSFVVVTHDRRFLEAVCNRVIELNKRYPEGHFSSAGNYSEFLKNREALFNVQAAREDSMRNIVRRETEWLRRGPKARTTKQKARIDRAGELMGELKELEYRNAQTRSAAIDFTASERKTKKLVSLTRVVKSLGGKKLFGPLDLVLGPGDKWGLLGGNGSGKSTLLKLLAGTLAPDAGRIERVEGLTVVTFDQHRETLDMAMPLRRALCESGEFVYYKDKPVHVVGWAERFLFGKEQLDAPLGRLSGGEQSRVMIARLMLRPADVLLLDEPTNDLDLNSLEVLETSLMDFAGALVLVTHDRYLLDRVSQRILALDGRGNARVFADLDQWEERMAADEIDLTPPSLPLAPTVPPAALSAAEARELRGLEEKIQIAEAQTQKARQALLDPAIATDAPELMERQKTVDALAKKTEALYQRWHELETKAGKSAAG
ncbi:MAG: ABC-F family ATP-binding cassette domain-containing protein [Elusimicrobia bacterium]|nr:ABC-F family ATP-binding cassette domain-containing protein [Elusimicrobiota bacterium]MBK7545313.1 ABC-F family ATP-binding cassette domain-containing protein [Elusimicrobiota bacterium]MBK7575670.1 ABC-F family ATP-binding cassette domain-containing protein [Elusimicrobiota bacterium]MBK8126999.1 ABC-F family ATP-binding cassette domain-containing protein [Elusimicrobiota bacterium]MBK8423797.1 ABC-F family ATP-binding cassette domain-containing protein [Elusimicrobiota bacterium]